MRPYLQTEHILKQWHILPEFTERCESSVLWTLISDLHDLPVQGPGQVACSVELALRQLSPAFPSS